MSYLIEWVTNIIVFILLATVIDMLLPNSNLQKYTKLVIGLLLIAVILAPIFKLVSNNFDSTIASISNLHFSGEENMNNSIDLQKKEIQAGEQAYILKEVSVQLKTSAAEELMKKYGFEIANISLSINETSNQKFPENLQKVSVLLKQPVNNVATADMMKPIHITLSDPVPSKNISKETNGIASFLSKIWNIDEKTINVSIEGGADPSNE